MWKHFSASGQICWRIRCTKCNDGDVIVLGPTGNFNTGELDLFFCKKCHSREGVIQRGYWELLFPTCAMRFVWIEDKKRE